MLKAVTAIRFDRQITSGKTRPCLVTAADEDGKEVELVVKLAAGCERRERSLMTEALVALLAADLDLPVPEPFLVKLESVFVDSIPDSEIQQRAKASLGWNFGSKKLPPAFSTYPPEKPLSDSLINPAAEILAFDKFIVNDDRTVKNPNLLFNGKNFAIIDHELALFFDGVLFWKPPWENQGVSLPKTLPLQYRHVFQEALRGKSLDFSRLTGAFKSITQDRLHEYRQALPANWIGDGVAVDRILEYINELKGNIDKAINNLTEALR